jgi:enamine deaminase RidA (YjgF/YER057c/UK114 family)
MTKIQQQKAQVLLHISGAGDGQAFFIASVRGETGAAHAADAAYSLIAEALQERQMEIVHERAFGSLEVEHIVKTVRKRVFQEHGIPHDTPVTYVQGNPPWGKGLAGVIIRAVACRERGDSIWTVKEKGIPSGRGWQRNGSRFLILQSVHGLKDDTTLLGTRSVQTQRMFENAHRILMKQGASYHDVLRTWIYISNIDEWYRKFNHARNYVYDKFGIMPSSEIPPSPSFDKGGQGGIFHNNNCFFPASTGIEGRTSSGAACTMDLIAAITPHPNPLPQGEREKSTSPLLMGREQGERDKNIPPPLRVASGDSSALRRTRRGEPRRGGEQGERDKNIPPPLRGGDKGEGVSKPLIRRLSNPCQAEAFHYYSAFSRGVLIQEPDVSIIQVSGTAAIDERGASLFPDGIHNQITCTLDKIESLISPEGANLKDICAATVFVKQPEYAEVFHEVAASRGLKELPYVCVVADICREELLFEMDAEAVVLRQESRVLRHSESAGAERGQGAK